MPKKKKTRKQKVVADTRHTEYFAEPLGLIPTDIKNNIQLEHLPHLQSSSKAQVIDTANYRYLYPDLLKTLMLTISIVVVEIVLRYFVFGA